MAYKPTDVIAGGDGYSEAVERIRAAMEPIPWLEKAFGRAFLLPERLNDEVYQYPQVYLGKGEYFNVMPNDQYKSYSWVIGIGAGEIADDTIQPFSVADRFIKETHVLVYANLQRVDKTKEYIYTDDLVADVVAALSKVPGFIIQEYYVESLDDVYGDYTTKEIDRDLLMYPYAGIRIVGDLSYNIKTC